MRKKIRTNRSRKLNEKERKKKLDSLIQEKSNKIYLSAVHLKIIITEESSHECRKYTRLLFAEKDLE